MNNYSIDTAYTCLYI